LIVKYVGKHFRNVASATTQGSRSPRGDAAIADGTMAPAPMPAAATSSPRPISLTTLVRCASVSRA
jgi:hypothetical protein